MKNRSRAKKNNDNMFDSLKKLNKLRLDGAITQEELNKKARPRACFFLFYFSSF